MPDDYEYVIIGGGSAGCVLANKLSAEPANRVLLVEAGPEDKSPLIHMPRGLGKLYASPKHTYSYEARRRSDGNSTENWLSGRMLGGSSSLNGMMYLRGHRDDYDSWANQLGLKDWGWKDYGRIFREMEDHELGDDGTRGTGGAQSVSVTRNRTRLMDKVIEAGSKLGLRVFRDANALDHEGIGYVNATIRNGRRWSAARAFLKPARKRPNLTVVTDTQVSRIVFDGTRAVGIEATHEGSPVTYRSTREIILSAGTLHSPQILQLSGIGPASLLTSFGIPVVADRPAVGTNLREHLVFRIQYRLSGDYSQNKEHTGWRLMLHALRYLVSRTGLLAAPPYDVTAFVRTRQGIDRPDAQLFVGGMSEEVKAAEEGFSVEVKLDSKPGASIIGYHLRPESQGTLMIRSADPAQRPEIHANFLSHPIDREVAVSTVRYMRKLFDSPTMRPYIREELLPGASIQSDEEIIAAYNVVGGPGYHAAGTCRMGLDADSVVDERLRVRGVTGLRVADVSVFPTLVSGNTNGPAMATAWRAAELILEDAGSTRLNLARLSTSTLTG